MRIRVAYIVLVHKRYSGLMYSQSENGIRSRYYNKVPTNRARRSHSMT